MGSLNSKLRVFLLAAIAALPLAGQEQPDAASRALFREAGEAAAAWLLGQKAPNARVPRPMPWRRNLIISYEIPEDDPAYPHLSGRAYTYDSALAAIAFSMTDRYGEAEDVLLALSRQTRPDGSLWFGVNVQNEWPSEQDPEGAAVRSGASAWAAYAAAYYLRKRALSVRDFAEKDRVGRQILAFAERAARHLLTLQVTDPEDARRGLITGGRGEYTLRRNEDGSVASCFVGQEVGWASAEHNIDAYFLFRDLAALTGDEKYDRAAEELARGLLSLWRPGKRQLIQGIQETGKRDEALPLDTASWGSMFLRAEGREKYADATLDAAMKRFQIGGSGHFRPYSEDPVYPDPEVSRSFFGDPDLAWKDLDVAWPEGSLGMAVALIRAGRGGEATRIIRAALDHSEGGALKCASREVPHLFVPYPSAASTAWFVIAVEYLLDPEDRALFWSGG